MTSSAGTISVLAPIFTGNGDTHKHLLTKAWAGGDADVHALRVHIRHLRQKIEDNPEQPVLILTEPGVGYRFMRGD